MPVVYFHSLLSPVLVINCLLFKPICQFENPLRHRSDHNNWGQPSQQLCIFQISKIKVHPSQTFLSNLQPNPSAQYSTTIWWTVTITSLLSLSLYTTVHFQRSVRSTSQGRSSSANRKKERVKNKHHCSIQFTQRSLTAAALLALVAFVHLCLLTCCKQTVWRKLALGLSSTCVAVKLGFWT